jgi:preprotein translocase subunit YajC
MIFFILTLLDTLSFIIPIILVGIFYYVYIYKPQKEKKAMLSCLKAGSKIVTKGGLLGTVISFGETYCIIELYDETQACILKNSIIYLQQ